jgi:uncharacterized Tic20 family protein
MNTTSTTEERLWAVISHISAIGFGMGILLPVVGWSDQRQKSRYASFQCLQALGYQSLGYTLWLLSYLLIMILSLIVFAIALGTAQGNSASAGTATAISITILMIVIVGMFGIYYLLPVIAAIACALGRDFRYPILGNRLAKYLGYQQTDDRSPWLIEEHEDRWVIAMGHLSVIIALWGMLAPFTTWIMQGKRSIFLKFQSIQTTAYQVFVNIIFMVGGLVYLSGMIALLVMTGLASSPNQSSPISMAGLLVFGILLLMATAIILILPLFHILGQWAGYRVLKGDDYHYPILGKFVEKWIDRERMLAADSGSSLKGKWI